MQTYEDLAAARRQWIDQILKPWCAQAPRRELLAAQQDWPNLAGKVDPDKTLWAWAWGRFADLVHEELSGIDETIRLQVTLNNGEVAVGYPDARESTHGNLVLLTKSADAGGTFEHAGPFSIDEIASVQRVDSL